MSKMTLHRLTMEHPQPIPCHIVDGPEYVPV